MNLQLSALQNLDKRDPTQLTKKVQTVLLLASQKLYNSEEEKARPKQQYTFYQCLVWFYGDSRPFFFSNWFI